MVKKLLIAGIVSVLSLVSVGVAAAAQTSPGKSELPIKVLYNARQVVFPDAQPKMDGNRILVPVRFVAETLGASVDYRDKLVTIRQEGKVIELPIGSNVTKVNGQSITLDTKAMVVNERTYVPLRFVSEALGQTVEWDAIARFVWIGHKDVPKQEEVGEKRTFDEFLPMYGKRTAIINQYDFENDAVYVFTQQQLPIRLAASYAENTIYRIWEDEHNGKPVFKVHYRGPHIGLYFLTDSNHPRRRHNVQVWRVKNPDGSFIGTFSLRDNWDEIGWGLKDWDKFDYGDIRYIGFMIDSSNMPLLKYN